MSFYKLQNRIGIFNFRAGKNLPQICVRGTHNLAGKLYITGFHSADGVLNILNQNGDMMETLIPMRLNPTRYKTGFTAFPLKGLIDKQTRIAGLSLNLGPPAIEFQGA